ncbi:MAG: hypothetical protein HOV94_32980, partial [Saccharothrix sp.]|nr:hypothetical protein [Saccharothrix sp.]
ARAAEASAAAGEFAVQAGADAQTARGAAAAARAAAGRAKRAAEAADDFAAVAADAAEQAKNAATRAAANANAAATAADEAAEHAGRSADAANEATAHANAAYDAAQVAIAAAAQAQRIYDAAREVDERRLAAQTEQAVEIAVTEKSMLPPYQAAPRWDSSQASRRDTETNGWITEAGGTDVAPGQVAALGRRIALKLAVEGGPWTKAAAVSALSGNDEQVREYVRTGLGAAAGRDDRVILRTLADTGSDAYIKAAQDALSGDDETVRRFLDEPQYPGRAIEMRVSINQILAEARQSDRPTTRDAAQRALDAATPAAYKVFLDSRRYSAARTDDRIQVNRELAAEGNGPEVKAAAQVALDGPPAFQRHFLDVGRHVAARRDHEAAAHVAVVAGYLATAHQAASAAVHSAAEAAATAATARGAAGDAAHHATRAAEAAQEAEAHARSARDSAAQAVRSAEHAAESATTAQTAADSANQSARRAAQSAVWADASSEQASRFAERAYRSAQAAYDMKIAAGQDAAAANEAAGRALADAVRLGEQERETRVALQSQDCARRWGAGTERFTECYHRITMPLDERIEAAYANAGICELIYPNTQSTYHRNCLGAVLDPNFQELQLLTVQATLAQAAGAVALTAGLGGTGLLLGAVCTASVVCGGALLAIAPEGAAFTPWMALTAVELSGGVAGTRMASVLEGTLTDIQILNQTRATEIGESVLAAGRGPVGTVPQGLTAGKFAEVSVRLRAGLGAIGEGEVDIVVQGSRAAGTARPDSDIDFAIRVSPERFDELIALRFKTPNPGSSKEKTMNHAIATGKIQAGELGLSGFRKTLKADLGMEVDLSVIRVGGPFDNPPFVQVP